MKNRFKLTLVGILLLNSWSNAQSIEAQLQAVIDTIYITNPSSVGILVLPESKYARFSASSNARKMENSDA